MNKNIKKEKASISIHADKTKKLKNDILLTNKKKSLSTAIEFEYKALNFLTYNILKELKGLFNYNELQILSKLTNDNLSQLRNNIFGYKSSKVRDNKMRANYTSADDPFCYESSEIKTINIESDINLNRFIYYKIIDLSKNKLKDGEFLKLNELAVKFLKLNENQVFSLLWYIADLAHEDANNSLTLVTRMLLDEEELINVPGDEIFLFDYEEEEDDDNEEEDEEDDNEEDDDE